MGDLAAFVAGRSLLPQEEPESPWQTPPWEPGCLPPSRSSPQQEQPAPGTERLAPLLVPLPKHPHRQPHQPQKALGQHLHHGSPSRPNPVGLHHDPPDGGESPMSGTATYVVLPAPAARPKRRRKTLGEHCPNLAGPSVTLNGGEGWPEPGTLAAPHVNVEFHPALPNCVSMSLTPLSRLPRCLLCRASCRTASSHLLPN